MHQHTKLEGGRSGDAPPATLDGEAEAALRLLRVDGIGQARLRTLRAAAGDARAALALDGGQIADILRIAPGEAARMLRDAHEVDLSLDLGVIRELGARVVLEGDGEYPELLLATHDPPALLFVRGALSAAPEAAVAIVGSRRASAYGRLQAGRLAAELAARGVAVVSGGARGIDAESHRGALRAGGRTIAVMATGLARPYPEEHVQLFDAIVESGGCAMTEQTAAVAARPDLFPRRNRLIAALALVTVVVEAADRSGALLTARIAVDDLSREAGCLPGPVDSPTSAGCHRAIREGWAQLITGADDVCELLEGARTVAAGAHELAAARRREAGGRTAPARTVAEMPPSSAAALPRPSAPEPESSRQGRREPSPDGRAVLECIRRERRAGLDELERVLAWTVPRIACATLELEVAGWIARDAEGAYREVVRPSSARR
jgi:DNA processing protein